MKKNVFYAVAAAFIICICIVAFETCSEKDVGESTYPDAGGNSAGIQGYDFNVTFGEEEEATRATYVDGSYLWDADDKIALYMFPAGETDPVRAVFTNRTMDKEVAEQSKKSQFRGTMTQEEIDSVDPNATYDYYFYGPNVGRISYTGSFPNLSYDIPGERTATTEYFSCPYMMVRGGKFDAPPVTWLDESQQQAYAESIGFEYEHVFSFINMQIDCNLMSKPVTRIDISSADGTALAGRVEVDISTGDVNIVGNMLSTIRVNIPDGFDVLDNNILVTVLPGDYMAGKELRFTFYVTDDAGAYFEFYDTSVTAPTFRAGVKHRVRFQLPFYVDLTHDLTRLADIQSAGVTLRQFRSCGHTMTGNAQAQINTSNGYSCMELIGATAHANDGCIKLPLLNYVTNPDYTRQSNYVRVKVEASAPWGYVSDATRVLLYGGAASTVYNLPVATSPYFQLLYYLDQIRAFQEYDEAEDGRYFVQIGADSYVTFQTNVDWLYNVFIRKIWIYPNFDYLPE